MINSIKMDLNSAVQFSPFGSADASDDIRKIIDEYRIRSQEMGFYDQRMAYGSYNENLEEELKAAYDETSKLENDIRQLVTIADVLVEQVGEYEQKITDMRNEKEHVFAETDYMQENMDALIDREKEKDNKILQLEAEITSRDRALKRNDLAIQSLQAKIQQIEEELEEKKEELFKKNEVLVDRETENDDKMRSLQDLIEYKDEHINELQENLDKMDERLEQIEKERDSLERQKEELQKTIADTKDNMAHYRNSCQTLSKELKAVNETLYEVQARYEILQRKETEHMMKRMDSGSSLGSMEGQFMYDPEEKAMVAVPNEQTEDLLHADTLGDELNELENMADFDNHEDMNEMEGDFGGLGEGEDYGIHDGYNHDQDEHDNVQEFNQYQEEQHQIEQTQNLQEQDPQEEMQSMEQIEVHDIEMQTEGVQSSNRKLQTDNKNKKLADLEVQTDENIKETFSVNIQTEEIRKLHCSIRIQTSSVKTKDKSLDTTDLPVEKPKVRFEEPKEILVEENDEKETKSTKSRPKKQIFLDNISSPSDSGSQKNAAGSQNVLNSNTSATSNGSGGGFNKKDLTYMLNRDPLKEFFHLTLQSIRMNSPHMNQILNVDCDQFYKKASESNIPFNQWGRWIEDQLNRIVLSRILKLSLFTKMKETENVPNITINKVEQDVDKMDSKGK